MRTCVFVLDNTGKAKVKYVNTGVQDDQFIHVIQGLSKDEQVITGPYDEVAKSLSNGDEVTIGEIELKEEK